METGKRGEDDEDEDDEFSRILNPQLSWFLYVNK